MCSRQNLVEIFSTFLQWDDTFLRSQRWISDRQLHRSISHCLEQFPEASTSEPFWVLYFHKRWLTSRDRLAEAHLTAYLQETCYWTVQKTLTHLRGTLYPTNCESDLFQTAIASIPQILRNYNPDRSSLISYARLVFRATIQKFLLATWQIEICTDWALLRKLSRKRLVAILENAGWQTDAIARCQLAWTCFKTLYVPVRGETRKLVKPDRATWDAIAQLYNQLDPTHSPVSPEQLETWLLQCAKRVRASLSPQIVSLNAPTPGQQVGELQDCLPDRANPSLLAVAIAREQEEKRQQQRAQIGTVLSAAIARLTPQTRELLQQYYARGLTQQQIGDRLGLQQYQVSRQLSRARQSLFEALVRWSQTALDRSMTARDLQAIGEILEEWLLENLTPAADAIFRSRDRSSRQQQREVGKTA